ncbi:MAG: DUF721 domain-containing protein [Fimbriimonadaceae bacterium]
MKRVQDWIAEALGRPEVVRKARALSVLRRWPEVVGPVVARKSHPDRYDKGTVWVAVAGSSWAQELRMQRDQILLRLNELAGEADLFKEIRFGVRPFVVSDTPQPEPTRSALRRADTEGLSIREIAERRLAKRSHGRSDPS